MSIFPDHLLHSTSSGTYMFLVDAYDLQDVEVAFSRLGLEILSKEEAIFGRSGKVLEYELQSDATKDNIEYALQTISKSIRPFPKKYFRE